MTIEIIEGGWYYIHVNQDTLSVYMSWTFSNDVIRTDDGESYIFYKSPRKNRLTESTFLDGYKVNGLISVGTIGGGGGGDEQQSAGEEPVTMSSTAPSEPQDDTTPATSYGYALDGRRVGKAGHVDMKYLYDGENVIYEMWDNMLVRFTTSSFVDHPIKIIVDSVKYFYLYDGLGSVTEIIDANETIVNFYRYSPFGSVLVKEETVYNPYQFTGRQFDKESGLYHYRARAYSPSIGRFMQQDPAGMVDGANMYAYVGNNPTNMVDPSGMLLLSLISITLFYFICAYNMCAVNAGITAHGASDPDGGKNDKYQHCLWSASMINLCGLSNYYTQKITDTKEYFDVKVLKTNTPAQSQCDKVANRVGRDIRFYSGYTAYTWCNLFWWYLKGLGTTYTCG